MHTTRFDRLRSLLSDSIFNSTSSTSEKHILLIRDLYFNSQYNDHFLRWIRQTHSKISNKFILKRWSNINKISKNCALVVLWIQDPIKERDINAYNHIKKIESICQTQGIPVINPADIMSHSIKSFALNKLQDHGIRTAKNIKIDNPDQFILEHNFSYPFFIREDNFHSPNVKLINSKEELESFDFSYFSTPLAMEYIDTKSPDGLFRKFRYFLAGDKGTARHLVIGKEWFLKAQHRIINESTKKEELEYLDLPKDPNHEILNKARKLLEFDTVAFDYSYDQNGNLIIWEPNPFPFLYQLKTFHEYQRPSLIRCYEALLNYYLDRAGIIYSDG